MTRLVFLMTKDPELEKAKERPSWQYGNCRYCKHYAEHDESCEQCTENPQFSFMFEWKDSE